MTLLTGETDVFQAGNTSSCGVVFLARRRAGLADDRRQRALERLAKQLDSLAAEGWVLSARAMFGSLDTGAWAYDSSFAHDVDIAGVFDAPSPATALSGIAALESSGWDELMSTEWIVGPREFAPVASDKRNAVSPTWGFLALWEWNDAWQAATADERQEYDRECDIAFQADLNSGIDIAGRHRLDWASSWHHLGIWEADDLNTIDEAMREHERVADFKFTTSRHFIGRRRPLLAILGKTHV
jgi:hypothetical protein